MENGTDLRLIFYVAIAVLTLITRLFGQKGRTPPKKVTVPRDLSQDATPENLQTALERMKAEAEQYFAPFLPEQAEPEPQPESEREFESESESEFLFDEEESFGGLRPFAKRAEQDQAVAQTARFAPESPVYDLKQAVIMSEILRMPRVKRRWPAR